MRGSELKKLIEAGKPVFLENEISETVYDFTDYPQIRVKSKGGKIIEREYIPSYDNDVDTLLYGKLITEEQFENYGKSFRNFVPHESDKEFKRRFQAASPEERKGWGYDLVDTDDPEGDVAYCRQANEWLRDGQPVD